MSPWLKGLVTGGIAVAAVTLVAAAGCSRVARPAAAPFMRMPDGKPNLNGIWAANNTANWDIETHQARQGPVIALGAAFSVPGGIGVVEGGEIPYKPEALRSATPTRGTGWRATRRSSATCRACRARPTCRIPFQIVQSTDPNDILMAYEFASASRIVHMSDATRRARSTPGWDGRAAGGTATRSSWT